MTGKTMGWMLGIGLAVGGTLFTAAPARADHHDHDRGRGWSHHRDDDRVGVSIGFGVRPDPRPVYVVPAPARHWVEGHYETREEQVQVEAGHYEDRYVPAVYETRYDHCNRPYRVQVCPPRYEQVWCPPKYETRCTQVWVPGYWVEDPCPGPVVVRPAPRHERPNWFFGFRGTFHD